jgi:hypothetical protein
MRAMDNRTPFAAERSWVRDRESTEIWLVAVKGTYNIDPAGETILAYEQVKVFLAPQYFGEPGKSRLEYNSDLPRTKEHSGYHCERQCVCTAWAPDNAS